MFTVRPGANLSAKLFFLLCLLFLHVSISTAEEPIRIGTSLSLSGIYREPSHMIRKGYEMWVKNINESGGLLDRKVELVLLDDASDESAVRENYLRLLKEEEVDLVLSPYSTPLTLQASDITEEAGYVMIAGGASGSQLWNRGYKYLFGVYSMADRYFIGYLDLIARQGIDRVSIVFEDTVFNRDAARGAFEWAGKMGVEVDEYISYIPGEDSPENVLIRAGLDEETALIICSYTDDGYAFLSVLRDQNIRPAAIAMTVTPIHPLFAHRLGPSAQGIFGPSQWEPVERIPYPGTKEFIENFRTFAHMSPSYHAGSAYAACQILEKSVTETGSLDNKILRDYIMSIDTVTVIGRFKVNHLGMQIGHNPLLIQWQYGKKEIVYPRRMSTAEAVFP